MPYIEILHIEPYPKMKTYKTLQGRRQKQHTRPLYLCPECDRVWQSWCSNNGKQWEYLWEGFPKYGQKRKTCPDCEAAR